MATSTYYFFSTVQIASKWESSGNGFGQRAQNDSAFGHWSAEHVSEAVIDGDKRSNFVALHMGQRFHHLYLWVLLDRNSIMSLVLTKLSDAVAMDCENIHADTSRVQRPRNNKRKIELNDLQERTERRAFRRSVGNALSLVAASATADTKLRTMLSKIQGETKNLVALEGSLTKDEDKILDLRVKLLEAQASQNDALASVFQEFLDHHRERVTARVKEIDDLKGDISNMRYQLAKAEHEVFENSNKETIAIDSGGDSDNNTEDGDVEQC